MLAFCIAGHHAGLANGKGGAHTRALDERLNELVPEPDPVWRKETQLPDLQPPGIYPRSKDTAGLSASAFIRMIFSALVDADFLDTERYFAGLHNKPVPRDVHPSLDELADRLHAHLAEVAAHAPNTRINTLRAEVLEHVRRQSRTKPGVFTLTVPTGGGKTLASLAFALAHALRHGLHRVIYVIPYTSIIEQTATVFRQALHSPIDDNADFVLEHHSAFDEERIGHRESQDKLRLAMVNWDAPIIVTTAVQFFESLFANRPSRCRKLHNIANSVVVLDEAQTLPLGYLRPCIAVVDDLARNWRTSVVLCTATQPALAEADGFVGGFERPVELAPEPRRLYSDPVLKRTRVRQQGELNDSQLAENLRQVPQVLCIVNTRKHARDLYELLRDVEGACHLSTLMCPAHRSEHLTTLRSRLEARTPVRLISTSLVEAGVDIDFPQVWRAEAGLESIVQAAGRCNREGKQSIGEVIVFEPHEADGHNAPVEVSQLADSARSVLRKHKDPLSLDALGEYFREVYWTKGRESLDAKGILRMLEERKRSLDFPFETIARQFRLIESTMVPVIVPYCGQDGDSERFRNIVHALERAERPGWIARRLQPYVVQIPPRTRETLLAAGAAVAVQEERFERQFVVLTNEDLYLRDVGLTWDDPTFREAEGLVV